MASNVMRVLSQLYQSLNSLTRSSVMPFDVNPLMRLLNNIIWWKENVGFLLDLLKGGGGRRRRKIQLTLDLNVNLAFLCERTWEFVCMCMCVCVWPFFVPKSHFEPVYGKWNDTQVLFEWLVLLLGMVSPGCHSFIDEPIWRGKGERIHTQ